MLSSVAERLYWTSRYLERAEVTARLVNAYGHFILDIPRGFEPGWQSLIRIIDGNEAFERRFKKYSERNVMDFLIADEQGPGSVRSSINSARQNVRTTRDSLPESFWELVNELNIYVRENAADSLTRRNRYDFLETVTAKMQQLTGVIDSSMTRDHAYRFMRLGTLLERADMTSRVLDVAVETTLGTNEEEVAAASWLWVNLLRSLSALSAYRREVGPLIDGGDIVEFIFKSKSFPRSVHYCLNSIDEVAQGLSNPKAVWYRARRARSPVLAFPTDEVSLDALHTCIDDLQLGLMELHNEIQGTWFTA